MNQPRFKAMTTEPCVRQVASHVPFLGVCLGAAGSQGTLDFKFRTPSQKAYALGILSFKYSGPQAKKLKYFFLLDQASPSALFFLGQVTFSFCFIRSFATCRANPGTYAPLDFSRLPPVTLTRPSGKRSFLYIPSDVC